MPSAHLPCCTADRAIMPEKEAGTTGCTSGCEPQNSAFLLQERVYDVGSHCASRVHLYHSLWHYKRRLRGQLKKELKAARLFLEVRKSLLCGLRQLAPVALG